MATRDWFRSLFVIVLLLFTLVVFLGYERFFTRQDIRITVLSVDAPTCCRSKSSILWGAKARSHSLTNGVFGYCGVIKTNVGYYKLPQSSRISIISDTREEIHSKLLKGCTLLVGTYGFGAVHKEGDIPSNRGNRTIYKIREIVSCP